MVGHGCRKRGDWDIRVSHSARGLGSYLFGVQLHFRAVLKAYPINTVGRSDRTNAREHYCVLDRAGTAKYTSDAEATCEPTDLELFRQYGGQMARAIGQPSGSAHVSTVFSSGPGASGHGRNMTKHSETSQHEVHAGLRLGYPVNPQGRQISER